MEKLMGKVECLQYLDSLEKWISEGDWTDDDELAFKSIRSYVKEYVDPRQAKIPF